MNALKRERSLNFIKQDFKALQGLNRGKPLVYLDSAASAQKPQVVIDAVKDFYEHDYANIHRGIYELSERATTLYDQARHTVKNFINANDLSSIIFTAGTTAGINLVAQSFAQAFLKADDEIIISTLEHHANIVAWHFLKEQKGIQVKVVPITDEGVIDLEALETLINRNTKLVALSHVSNALGTIQPIKSAIQMAHQFDVPVLIDGAQAVPHMKVDVTDLDCDFYVFSSHKLYGPSGIGVLYMKPRWLESLPPYQGGGDMIATVSFDEITYAAPPQKFEAGTPHLAGAHGLGAAINYLNEIGLQTIFAHGQELLDYATNALLNIPGLKIYGTAPDKIGLVSFLLDGIHPHDLGSILDHEGIAIRAGHHCAMPLMQYYQIPATVRASFGIYNDKSDVDALMQGIEQARRIFN